MEWLAIPLTVLVMAFLINGFPNIKIGGTHHYHNVNEDDDE